MKTPFSIAFLAAMAPCLCPAQADPEDRTIYEGAIGSINGHSTRAEIASYFGEENLRTAAIQMRDLENYPGEDMFGAKLCEGTDDFLELVWVHNPKTGVFRAERGEFSPVVGAVIIHGKNWKTELGIGVGSTLSEVAEANGKPFELLPFETCGAGQVASWDGGALSPDLKVQFCFGASLTDAEYQRYVFAGNKFLSSDPELAAMKPTVAGMWVEWGDSWEVKSLHERFVARLEDKGYPSIADLVKEVRSGQEPWDRLFTVEIDGEQRTPDASDASDANWQVEELFNLENLACIQLTFSLQDGIGAGSSSSTFVSAILLLESGGRHTGGEWHLSDLLVRRGIAYDGVAAKALVGLDRVPQIYLDHYHGGRRMGEHVHQVFSISRAATVDPFQFHPSVAFNARYSQLSRDESCEVSVVDGKLQVDITHEWMQDPDKGTTHTAVVLPWDPETMTFDASPLDGLVSDGD